MTETIEINEGLLKQKKDLLPNFRHKLVNISDFLRLLQEAKNEGRESMATLLMAIALTYDENFLIVILNEMRSREKDEFLKISLEIAKAVVKAKKTNSHILSIFNDKP